MSREVLIVRSMLIEILPESGPPVGPLCDLSFRWS